MADFQTPQNPFQQSLQQQESELFNTFNVLPNATGNWSGAKPYTGQTTSVKKNKPSTDSNAVYSIDSSTGVITANDNGQLSQVYWFPINSSENAKPTSSTEQAQKYFLDWSHRKDWGSIRAKLAQWNPAATSTDIGALNAIESMLREGSIYNYFQTAKAPDGKFGKTLSALDYLKTQKPSSSSGSGAGSAGYTITGKKEAWDLYRSTVEQVTGESAHPKDFNKFYADLVAEQRKYVSSQGVTNQMSPQDYTLRYVVSNMDATADLKGKMGSYQNQVNQLIHDSGLDGKIGNSQIAKYVKGLAINKTTMDDVNDALRAQAQISFAPFAEDIKSNPNLTVKDIMASYSNAYQQTFETDSNIDLADVVKHATGQDGKKLSLVDFQNNLKNDARYSYTNQAKQNAVNLARSFASAFGVNV